VPDQEEEVEQEAATDDDRYYRTLAKASIDLLDRLGNPGSLSSKQVNTLRNRLRTAIHQKGAYQPPVLVPSLKTDGTRRRVFTSLRLYSYRRLLEATGAQNL
jgi:hypothetical protein